MPGQMMHLYVGSRCWQQRNRQGDYGQFLLGCIAPDGVNAKGFASKEMRWHAHLRDENLSVWKENARRFYQQQQREFCDRDYLFGYFVHVMTDILWDESFNQALDEKICALTQDGGERNRLRWNELFLFGRAACFMDWWKDARPAFAGAKARAVNGICETMIELLQKDTLFWYERRLEAKYGTAPSCFVTLSDAEALAQTVIAQAL